MEFYFVDFLKFLGEKQNQSLISKRKRQKTIQINEKNRILNTSTITKFEHLPNELILICFDYFDFYWLYELFFDLNQRLNELILYQAKIYINLKSIRHEKFLAFCLKLNQLIIISQNYPLSIHTWSEDRFNLIFNDDLTKDKFSKLKSISISNIKVTTLNYILFDETIKLYETLERLSLESEISGEDYGIEGFCSKLISSKMKLLKYLHLNFEPYSCGCEHGLQSRDDYVNLKFEEFLRNEKSLSNMETIIIGYIPEDDNTETTTKLSFNTLLKNLLPYLPKLKNLIINSIDFNDNYRQQYQ
ncbi:unnamed protein product, partial [Rotaria sp. Silwood1]